MTSPARSATPSGCWILLAALAVSACSSSTRSTGPGDVDPPPVAGAGSPGELYASASAACASMPLRTTGTIYHFCECSEGAQRGCTAGDDSSYAAHRCSAEHPCRTWSQAIAAFNAMNAGDTIALCKGGAWAVASGYPEDGSNQLTNPRCAAGSSLTDPANASTCDLRDYAPSWYAGTARPALVGLLGSRTDGSGHTFEVGSRIVNRYDGSTNGVRILNLEFRGGNNGPNGGAYHDYRAITAGLYGPSHDAAWLVCGNDFNHLRLAMQMPNTGTMTGFHITGNRFTMIDQDAFLGGAGDDNWIDANLFDDTGGFQHPVSGNRAHTVYITNSSNPDATTTMSNMHIVNNQFYRSGAAGAVGPCQAATIVGHGQWTHVTVENNLHDGGESPGGQCWAIDLRAAGSQPTYFRGLVIRRNWISANVGIVAGQAPGVLIENNVVVNRSSQTWQHGIISPRDAARAGMDDVQDGAVIRNNTIYLAGSSGDDQAILVETEGTGHVIANNAVYAAGGACFTTPLPAGAYAFVGNNACFGGAAWGTTYDPTAHVTSDPLFAAAPTDLTPAAGSPLIRAGSAAHAPSVDFDLKARGTPPAIGAHEPD